MNKAKLRAFAFFAVLAWMMLNPLVRQGLGVRTVWLRDWGMMANMGLPMYDVRYYDARSKWQALPYQSLLAPAGRPYASALRSDAEVVRLGERLCAQLGPGADVRVVTRRGTRRGWVSERHGERNLCAR
jgi:hypothetical protein